MARKNSTTLNLRVDPELKRRLAEAAAADRRPITTLIEKMIEDYLEANAPKAGKAKRGGKPEA